MEPSIDGDCRVVYKRRKRSAAWIYFDKEDEKSSKSRCTLCDAEVKHCSNTSNLFKVYTVATNSYKNKSIKFLYVFVLIFVAKLFTLRNPVCLGVTLACINNQVDDIGFSNVYELVDRRTAIV